MVDPFSVQGHTEEHFSVCPYAEWPHCSHDSTVCLLVSEHKAPASAASRQGDAWLLGQNIQVGCTAHVGSQQYRNACCFDFHPLDWANKYPSLLLDYFSSQCWACCRACAVFSHESSLAGTHCLPEEGMSETSGSSNHQQGTDWLSTCRKRRHPRPVTETGSVCQSHSLYRQKGFSLGILPSS